MVFWYELEFENPQNIQSRLLWNDLWPDRSFHSPVTPISLSEAISKAQSALEGSSSIHLVSALLLLCPLRPPGRQIQDGGQKEEKERRHGHRSSRKAAGGHCDRRVWGGVLTVLNMRQNEPLAVCDWWERSRPIKAQLNRTGWKFERILPGGTFGKSKHPLIRRFWRNTRWFKSHCESYYLQKLYVLRRYHLQYIIARTYKYSKISVTIFRRPWYQWIKFFFC